MRTSLLRWSVAALALVALALIVAAPAPGASAERAVLGGTATLANERAFGAVAVAGDDETDVEPEEDDPAADAGADGAADEGEDEEAPAEGDDEPEAEARALSPAAAARLVPRFRAGRSASLLQVREAAERRRGSRKARRNKRKQRRTKRRQARRNKRKQRRVKRRKRRQARRNKRKQRRLNRRKRRQARGQKRKKRNQARRQQRNKRREANRKKRAAARKKRLEARRKRQDAARKKRQAAAAANAKKKGAAAHKAEQARKAAKNKKVAARRKKQDARRKARNARRKARSAKRRKRWQTRRAKRKQRRAKHAALVSSEADAKNKEIAAEKAKTPKVAATAPGAKQCHPKGPTDNVCSVSGGGNVSPFGGAKLHRLGKVRSALMAKFLTKDRKFFWWVATRHMMRKRDGDTRVQHVAARCGNDKVRVMMRRRGGDVPWVFINKQPRVRLMNDKKLSLPGAPKDKRDSYFVRRIRFTQGKGQKSLVEVEINCGHALPGSTPYASGVRVNAVWTGWESKTPGRDLRGQVRVLADARYQNLLKGQCRWGDVEAYPRWPRDPPAEATPEFAGGTDENVKCDTGSSSDSMDASASVPVDGSSSSSGGDEASADSMVSCRKKVESCTGITMGKAQSWFKRVDGDVTKVMADAVKGCAADQTKGDKVDRPQVCAQVCGWVQDARAAVEVAIKDALSLATTCDKAQQAETMLQRYTVERRELASLCGGKPSPALDVVPKLPACKSAEAKEELTKVAAKAAAAAAEADPKNAEAARKLAEADQPALTTKQVLQTLSPGQVAKLSPRQEKAVDEAVRGLDARDGEAAPQAAASSESSAATMELTPGVEALPGLKRGQLMPCDYEGRDDVQDKLVPRTFEDDPSKPINRADFKTSCSKKQ